MTSAGRTEDYAQDDVRRAAERVTLACRALRAAANDLGLAHVRSGASEVDGTAEQLRMETERVCELAEQVARLGGNLAGYSLAAGAGR